MDDTNHKDDELEGRHVWESMSQEMSEIRGFLSAALYGSLRFVLKNVIWLVVLPTIGLSMAWWMGHSADDEYRVEMTVSYNHLEKKIYADMLEKLNAAISQEDLKDMPGFLKCSPESLKSLRTVDSENIKGEPLSEDLSVDRVPFNIILTVSETKHLSELENALITYLDSPDFVQERLKYNQEEGERLVRRYSQLIEQLKASLSDEENSSEGLSLALDDAYDKLARAEAQLIFSKNIEVLHGLMPASAHLVRQSTKRLWQGAGIGLFLGLVILLLKNPKTRKEQ